MSAAASVAHPRAARRVDRLAQAAALLTFGGVCAVFLVSSMLLSHWGVPYDLEGGGPIQKVHPGTWMLVLAIGATMLRFRSPADYLRSAVEAFPGAAVFFLGWVFLLWQTIAVQKLPFTPLIDTFFLPIAILLALAASSGRERARIALALHVILAGNCLLGLSEYLLGFRLTPYVAGALELEYDWRATALLGHPLTNALILGCYLIIMALGGGRDLPALLRPVAMGLAAASMVAFGGRTSMVLSFLAVALVLLWRIARALTGARVSVMAIAAGAVALPVLAVAIGGLHEAGFFDQMLERFVNDNGSAKARLIMLSLFNHLDWREIFLGPRPGKISDLQNLEGIQYGLESFYVAYALTYGLIVAAAFFLCLAFFCREVVRASTRLAAFPLCFFFLVAATSVSLSAKTTSFGLLVALIMTMLRPSSRNGTS